MEGNVQREKKSHKSFWNIRKSNKGNWLVFVLISGKGTSETRADMKHVFGQKLGAKEGLENTSSYRLNVYVPPQIHMFKPKPIPYSPNVVGLEGGTFRRWVGHEGGAFMSGMNVPIKETSGSFLTPSTVWGGHSGKEQGTESSHTLNLPLPWPWTSQPPELLFTSGPGHGLLLQQPRQRHQLIWKHPASTRSRAFCWAYDIPLFHFSSTACKLY